jgi:hypothetical protein
MKYKNNDVLEKFLNGEEATNGRNLHSEKDGDAIRLVNYSTIIAKITIDGVLLINELKYSVTTTKHQNFLKRNGGAFIELSEYDVRMINNWKKERVRLIFKNGGVNV